LCQAQSCSENFVFFGEVFTFQLTADVGLLKKGGSGKSEKFWSDVY